MKYDEGFGVMVTADGRTKGWFEFDPEDPGYGIGIEVKPPQITKDSEGNYHFISHTMVVATSFESPDQAQAIAEEFCEKNFEVLVQMKAQVRDHDTANIIEILTYKEAGFEHLEYQPDLRDELQDLRDSFVFTKETAYPNSPSEPPSSGHCAVVAFVVQVYIGGQIISSTVDGVSHWYNMIDDTFVDLTGDQFGRDPIQISKDPLYGEHKVRSRDEINKGTMDRVWTFIDNMVDRDSVLC